MLREVIAAALLLGVAELATASEPDSTTASIRRPRPTATAPT